MPEWKEEIRTHLAGLKLEPARASEIVEELAQHLEDRYAELRAGGATEAAAHRAALAELRESEGLARQLQRVERPMTREPAVLGARRTHMVADLGWDLRYGVHLLLKKPSFTLMAARLRRRSQPRR